MIPFFAFEDKDERRDADENVDEILKPRQRAENEIHDVPVATQPIAEPGETPIESADDEENECCFMQCFHAGVYVITIKAGMVVRFL